MATSLKLSTRNVLDAEREYKGGSAEEAQKILPYLDANESSDGIRWSMFNNMLICYGIVGFCSTLESLCLLFVFLKLSNYLKGNATSFQPHFHYIQLNNIIFILREKF